MLDLFAKFRKKYTEINQTNDSLKLCVENDFFYIRALNFLDCLTLAKILMWMKSTCTLTIKISEKKRIFNTSFKDF